ncbi:MAG TPA: hypothetical protein VM163_06565 [bacterium]|nr:hypothetical protein [bacterium]
MNIWAENIAKIDAEYTPFGHGKLATARPRHTGKTGTLDLANVSNPKSDLNCGDLRSRDQLLGMTEQEFAASGLIVTISTKHGTLYLIASHRFADQLPEGSVWLTGQEVLHLKRLELSTAGCYRIAKVKCLLRAQVVAISDHGLLLESPLHEHPINLLPRAPKKRPLPKDDEPTTMTVAEAELLANLTDKDIHQVLQVVRMFGRLTDRNPN